MYTKQQVPAPIINHCQQLDGYGNTDSQNQGLKQYRRRIDQPQNYTLNQQVPAVSTNPQISNQGINFHFGHADDILKTQRNLPKTAGSVNMMWKGSNSTIYSEAGTNVRENCGPNIIDQNMSDFSQEQLTRFQIDHNKNMSFNQTHQPKLSCQTTNQINHFQLGQVNSHFGYQSMKLQTDSDQFFGQLGQEQKIESEPETIYRKNSLHQKSSQCNSQDTSHVLYSNQSNEIKTNGPSQARDPRYIPKYNHTFTVGNPAPNKTNFESDNRQNSNFYNKGNMFSMPIDSHDVAQLSSDHTNSHQHMSNELFQISSYQQQHVPYRANPQVQKYTDHQLQGQNYMPQPTCQVLEYQQLPTTTKNQPVKLADQIFGEKNTFSNNMIHGKYSNNANQQQVFDESLDFQNTHEPQGSQDVRQRIQDDILSKLKKIWADTTEDNDPIQSIQNQPNFNIWNQESQFQNEKQVTVNLSEQLGIGQYTDAGGFLFKLHQMNQRAQDIKKIENSLQMQIERHVSQDNSTTSNRHLAVSQLLFDSLVGQNHNDQQQLTLQESAPSEGYKRQAPPLNQNIAPNQFAMNQEYQAQ